MTGHLIHYSVLAEYSLEYQEHHSDDTGEWVLTDMADSTKLGTTERIREKQAKNKSTSSGGKLTHCIKGMTWSVSGIGCATMMVCIM